MSWPDFFGVFLESLYTSSLKTQLTRVQFSSLRHLATNLSSFCSSLSGTRRHRFDGPEADNWADCAAVRVARIYGFLWKAGCMMTRVLSWQPNLPAKIAMPDRSCAGLTPIGVLSSEFLGLLDPWRKCIRKNGFLIDGHKGTGKSQAHVGLEGTTNEWLRGQRTRS